MIGQFPPFMSGEALCNEAVFEALIKIGIPTRKIDSTVSIDANSVGKFSVFKVFSAGLLAIRALKVIFSSKTVYITPGQTLFGLLRFVPIVLAGRLAERPVIIHWHGYGLLKLMKSHRRIVKVFLSQSCINVLLTEDLRHKCINHLGDTANYRVISNYSPVASIESLSEKQVNNRIQVVYLASLMPEKGFLEFIEASKLARFADFHVCGVGSAGMLRIAEKAQSDGFIQYHGLIHGKDKEILLERSDVVVLQTYYDTEGVPLTLLEAMSKACAIVTTLHNGIPETVGDSAVFIPPQETLPLVEKIRIFDADRPLLRKMQDLSFQRSHLFSRRIFEQSVLDLLHGATAN